MPYFIHPTAIYGVPSNRSPHLSYNKHEQISAFTVIVSYWEFKMDKTG